MKKPKNEQQMREMDAERIKLQRLAEENRTKPEPGRDLVRKRIIDTIKMRMESFYEQATLAELVLIEDLLGCAESKRSCYTENALANEMLWVLGLDNVYVEELVGRAAEAA